MDLTQRERVTVSREHDPEGEHELEQRNLKEVGQTEFVALAGLQCKHVSGFCPGPDIAGPSLSFPDLRLYRVST